MPFALKEEVKNDLNRLFKEGIITPVDYSE